MRYWSPVIVLVALENSVPADVTTTGNVDPAGTSFPGPFGLWVQPVPRKVEDLCVGKTGSGTLNVKAGGEVYNTYGYASFGTGIATVSGAGSEWTNCGDLNVGNSGSGRTCITDSGEVHVGGMTRTVEDSVLLLNVIAGPDKRDSESLQTSDVNYLVEINLGIEQFQITISPDLGFATVDSEVASLCEQFAVRLSEAGAAVEQVGLDWDDPYACWRAFFYRASVARPNYRGTGPLSGSRSAGLLEDALKLRDLDYSDVLTQPNEFWHPICRVFESFDLLITPILPVPLFAVGLDNANPFPHQKQDDLQWIQFTYPFNLTRPTRDEYTSRLDRIDSAGLPADRRPIIRRRPGASSCAGL